MFFFELTAASSKLKDWFSGYLEISNMASQHPDATNTAPMAGRYLQPSLEPPFQMEEKNQRILKANLWIKYS